MAARLHDEMHVTSVFVTHDQEEALEVADRVVVMNKGRIEQVGTPDEVYHHPATPFVYNFSATSTCFTAACVTAKSISATPIPGQPGPRPRRRKRPISDGLHKAAPARYPPNF